MTVSVRMKIALNQIMLDGGTQARLRLDMTAIAEYTEAMKKGDSFAPVDLFFDGITYWVGDGFHRCRAALEAGLKEIEAKVHNGTKDDAIWFAIGSNKNHGVRRNREDVENCIRIGLNHRNGITKSNVQLAEHIGVSEGTIRNYRKRLEDRNEISKSTKREGKDGRIFNFAANDIHETDITSYFTKSTQDRVEIPSNKQLEQDELEFKNPPSFIRMSHIHYGDGTVEEVPAIPPEDSTLRQTAIDFANQEAEADRGLTAQQWAAMPDEYIGDCFKQCYAPAKMVKGHVLEFGIRGVYVCSQCSYAYPPYANPAEVTLEDHINTDLIFGDIDELEWTIKDWQIRFGGLEGNPIEIARDLWLKEASKIEGIERSVFVDPVIAPPEKIEEAINYLEECYRRKTGRWSWEDKPESLFDQLKGKPND